MQRTMFMTRRLVPLLVVCLLVGAQNPNADKDRINLDGTWAVVSFERGGRQVPETFFRGMKMVFQGGKLLIQRGSRILGSGTYKLGLGQKPFVFDYREAPDVVSPYDAGIFQIEGSTLKLRTSA